MKKYILLLLLATFGTQAQTLQNPTFGNLKLKNNKTSTTATKVNVQEADGVVNTKPLSELVNYVEFDSAVNLPVTGEQGKLYLTKDNNRLYRFNGTIYQELTTDISGKEDIANKQNGLAVDGTNTKYPTVTAVNTALDLKANLASPALTGTPTAPTATAGTNTTQIATTAFVLANAGVGSLEFNATDLTVWNNGKGNVSTNTSFGDSSLKSNTTGSNSVGFGLSTLRDNTTGTNNTAIGAGALGLNTTGSKNIAVGSGAGQNVGHTIVNNSVFLGDGCKPLADNQTNQIVIGENATGAGSNTATLGNTSITKTVLRGAVETNGSFIKSSSPATNILLAGGGDIAQNTAFNKPFGITTGTAAQGNDSRILNGQTAFGWGNHAGLYPTYNGTGATGTWGINISGLAANSTKWNSENFGANTAGTPVSMLGYNPTTVRWEPKTAAETAAHLGLGSNAYTSTAFLPSNDGVRADMNYNTMLASGFYNSAGSNTNNPVGQSYSQLIVARGVGTGLQIAGGWGTDALHFRGWGDYGSGFSPWRKVWHDGNFNPANYLPLSGGDVSGNVRVVRFGNTFFNGANNSRNSFQSYNLNDSTVTNGWIAADFGDNGTSSDRVALGSGYGGKAIIGGHNGSLSRWSHLLINPNAGGVGIGIATTPSEKLEVGGNIKLSGSVTATAFFQSSDRRLKTILKRDGDIIYFKWKDGRDDKVHIGYIAQEVRKTNPDQVQKGENKMLSVNYVEILVEKIRMLEKRIEELEKK